jgi:hypothetical protein
MVSSVDLPKSSHSWPGRQNREECDSNALALLRQIRARADKAHVAFQNIKKLREFIETPST